MTPNDPLIRLLHTADAAAGSPMPPIDLADRVRRRRARQITNSKRIKIGLASITTAAVIVMVASIRPWQPPVPPGVGAPPDTALAEKPSAEPGANGANLDGNANLPNAVVLNASEIACLKSQADALGVEADALQRQLNRTRDTESRQELRQEHQLQVLARINQESLPSPLDCVALIGLSQGDFYRDIRQSLEQAKTEYESVIAEFPDSRWAELAQSRIELLNMN